jgi:hypothetical protein
MKKYREYQREYMKKYQVKNKDKKKRYDKIYREYRKSWGGDMRWENNLLKIDITLFQ